MRISLAEIERRIAPCGEIGRHLFENMETYNHSEHAGWTAGESWTLGDSPAVGVVLDPDCGFYHETEAPIILDDTTNKFEKEDRKFGCIHRWIRGLFWKILLRNWKFYMERVPIQNRYKKDV